MHGLTISSLGNGRYELLDRVGVPIPPSDVARQRQVREARVLASLESSHVVTVFDTFEEAGHQCVVMELCEESAAQRVARDGPFSVPEVLRVGEGALKALERAHAAGSCTGTSSPTTCCSLRTMCPRWRISAWRGCGRIRRR